MRRAGYVEQVQLEVCSTTSETAPTITRTNYSVVFDQPMLLDEAADAALQVFRLARCMDPVDVLQITVRVGDITLYPRPDAMPLQVQGVVTEEH